MTPLLGLVRRTFGRVIGIVAGLAAVLMAFQFLLVVIAASQEEAQSFDLIARLAPSFVQRQFGASLPAFLSFAGLVTFGYFHPVVMLMVSLCAVFLATELAADVESGYVDLILARPVARHRLVSRSLAAMMITAAVLPVLMMAASYSALALFAPAGARWPAPSTIATAAVHLVAIAWCFGSLGLAIAAVASRRLTAMGSAALVAVSSYLLDLLADSWQAIRPLAMLSPFHYYHGSAVLAGTADSARDLLVLGLATAVLTAVAYWRFNARDV